MSGMRPARCVVFGAMLAAWAGLVTLRLLQVQVLNGASYRARARQQQERTVLLPPRRGSILDRRGRELAVSVEASSVFAVPEKVKDLAGESAAIASALGIPTSEVRQKLSSDKGFV
jgi:cell division protein FtsI/penicillin-binding protein 2